ncbi:DNA oxidative demethylase AlkB [Ottowia thiooxydans]|uniref:DNA oxidative demethylase AlkB n=1 Tax=Ottowia thiooxydans TaxID=219182 RepID=UPI0006845296|nr:DNA oxidative demethylase AlkB [Ottowia thiooxydans]
MDDPLINPLAGCEKRLGQQAMVLRGFALPYVQTVWSALQAIIVQAPFRQMVTPGGRSMSVRLTNCGALGWTSDIHGYRYTPRDPESGLHWPSLPEPFHQLAYEAAAQAGFAGFVPDACLINRYRPGTRMSLHQDKNEFDYSAPIVSVSLGVPALFLWGGETRTDRAERVPLFHGDVVVWGGVDRLRFHGVAPIKESTHPLLGTERINLTFRRAGSLT